MDGDERKWRMSRSLNKAMLIGNLGSDPEIRVTSSGAKVAQFSLATSRSWTGRDGQQQEKTEWHRVVAWEKLADVCERYLKKGERVYVEGEIEYRQYEAKDGSGTRYTTEIRAREMMMLGGRPDDTPADEPEPKRGRKAVGAAAVKEPDGGFDGYDDDDLPF